MFLRLLVDVEVHKTRGVFVSKDDIVAALIDELPEPSGLYIDDSEYEITMWEPTIDSSV